MYPDIFFTEEYGKLFEPTPFGGDLGQFAHAGISYRFYARPITGTSYCDIVSPYGYSGPVVIGQYVNWEDFLSAFEDYCQRNKIVAEFARLHPWEKQGLQSSRVWHTGEVAYIDLTQTEQQIRHGFDKGCASAIKKAQRAGVKVEQSLSHIAAFGSLYRETMYRNFAKPEYLFTDAWFLKAVELLYPHIHLFSAMLSHEPVASALFLSYGDYCHYWFAGSNGEARTTGANNLLLSETVMWAKAQGTKVFNLGGGLSEHDSLSSFKRSFTRLTKPFYTYRKVHNQKVYDELCEARGRNPNAAGYFPAYRSGA